LYDTLYSRRALLGSSQEGGANDMLDVLHIVERDLPRLLRSRDGWTSLDVDYHPPRVERVYRAYGAHRISLHRIHPCAPAEALFHPHPWPSAMRVLEGRYEMGVGWGAGERPPPVAAHLVADGGMEYEMTDPDAWHYVRPIGGPALTLMVTGAPWSRPAPRSTAPLGPLPEAAVLALLERFRHFYPA
jgi:hypothetical protein